MKKIEKLLEYLSVALMASIALIITFQVTSRMLHSPVSWSEELARISLVYLTYISGAFAYSKGQGLRITLFVEKMPPKLQFATKLFTESVSLLVMLVIIYSGILVTIQLWDVTTVALKWQKGILTLVIPVAFTLLAFKWVENIKNLFIIKKEQLE